MKQLTYKEAFEMVCRVAENVRGQDDRTDAEKLTALVGTIAGIKAAGVIEDDISGHT